jgi:hypothetical protein
MNELDFWRAEPSKKAKAIANEIELLARRARASSHSLRFRTGS